MQSILVTCPEHDEATAYLTYFSKEVIRKAESKLIDVKEIKDAKLNIKDFSKLIKKIDPRFMLLNGHGSSDSIFGYKQEPIIRLGENDDMLKERIVYARSCNAGTILGPRCMENTKKGCFIGYDQPFIFFIDQKWSAKPCNDNVARLFLDPSNIVPLSIIKGHSSSEAHDAAKKEVLKTISRLLKKDLEQETHFYIEALWNNYTGQVIFGNFEAKF